MELKEIHLISCLIHCISLRGPALCAGEVPEDELPVGLQADLAFEFHHAVKNQQLNHQQIRCPPVDGLHALDLPLPRSCSCWVVLCWSVLHNLQAGNTNSCFLSAQALEPSDPQLHRSPGVLDGQFLCFSSADEVPPDWKQLGFVPTAFLLRRPCSSGVVGGGAEGRAGVHM